MKNKQMNVDEIIHQQKLTENEEVYLPILVEQWKTSVDFAKDISNRRQSMNGLLMTALSLFLGGILFSNRMSNINYYQHSIIVLIICLVGIGFCYLWVKQLNYYSMLNITKYNAIREIEKYLPAKIYTYENDDFYESQYESRSFSKMEKRIPMLFAFVFLVIIVAVGVPFLKDLCLFINQS